MLKKDELNIINEVFEESISINKKTIESSSKIILEISEVISKSLLNGGTIFLFGNGGSAADAQHIAAEFIGRFNLERNALSAEALTTNVSSITVLGMTMTSRKYFPDKYLEE
jgi:D-sedoheptulose 7-phosphate isomerase